MKLNHLTIFYIPQSGLLMSVIRTLSASETNEQREKERAKLEKEYKKSDARLDELVAAHALEIMEVMQVNIHVDYLAINKWLQTTTNTNNILLQTISRYRTIRRV